MIRIVGYPDPISKKVLAFRRLTTPFDVYTPNLNTDPLKYTKLCIVCVVSKACSLIYQDTGISPFGCETHKNLEYQTIWVDKMAF